jgi:hypothetical protein
MAAITLGPHVAQIWPVGTTVEARPEARVVMHQRGRRGESGSGKHSDLGGAAAITSAAVTGSGLSLSHAGLEAGVSYILSGVVGGELRTIQASAS